MTAQTAQQTVKFVRILNDGTLYPTIRYEGDDTPIHTVENNYQCSDSACPCQNGPQMGVPRVAITHDAQCRCFSCRP